MPAWIRVVQRPGPLRLAFLPGVFCVAGLSLLLGCTAKPPQYAGALFVFGTLTEVTVVGFDNEDSAREVVSSLESTFRRMHRDWHAWKPGRLTRLNDALSDGQWHHVDADLLQLVQASLAPASASGNRFNPAIGRLVALWGFHADELPVGRTPDAEAIAALVAANPRLSDLEFRGDEIRSRNPDLQLDFGAFAKGYALDVARDELATAGAEGALLNAGGDLCVMGEGTDGPWQVGIRDPFAPQALLAMVSLGENLCAMTSGNYERYRQGEGIRWGHLLDPRTGYPVREVASATVIHPNGAWADAAATALAVAGRHWREVAASMGLEQVLVVTGDGAVAMTPAFRRLLSGH